MNSSQKRRVRTAWVATASATVLLAGCSSGSDGEAQASASATSCTPQPDGAAAQAVKVDGKFGAKPSVKLDGPVTVDDIQVHVATQGDGEVTKTGDSVNTVISIFSAKNGKLATSQAVDLEVGSQNLLPAFNAGIDCVKIGSRVVAVVPPDKLFGKTGNDALGIAPDATVIVVTDVKSVTAPPTVEEWTEGVPKVSFDDKGVPKIELPGTKAPAGLKVKVLKQGDGATVARGDSVTLDYQGVSWKDGKVFDQSYGAQPANLTTSGVIPGFGAAIVGQKVGTQLLVTIPTEYAYGEGSQAPLAGQDLVFLIDIKATGSAPSASASGQ